MDVYHVAGVVFAIRGGEGLLRADRREHEDGYGGKDACNQGEADEGGGCVFLSGVCLVISSRSSEVPFCAHNVKMVRVPMYAAAVSLATYRQLSS